MTPACLNMPGTPSPPPPAWLLVGTGLWGLGTAVRSPTARIRQEALVAFALGATRRSPYPRAMAFAGLGAAEVLRVQPDHALAAALLLDAAAAVGISLRYAAHRTFRA
jgi:hypothetical protein